MTLNLNKLEKVMELEEQLRSQHQGQLDEKAAKIEELTKKQDGTQSKLRATEAGWDLAYREAGPRPPHSPKHWND
jgi:hypothetical protein